MPRRDGTPTLASFTGTRWIFRHVASMRDSREVFRWWLGTDRAVLHAELDRAMRRDAPPRVQVAACACILRMAEASWEAESGDLAAWILSLPPMPDPIPPEVERFPHGRERAERWRARRAAGMI